jgi:hypothetical protein
MSRGAPLPEAAWWIAVGLRQASRHDIKALASASLTGSVPTKRAGEPLYVAAALQVYFTRLAAILPAQALRRLPRRSLCPCCESTPVTDVVTASGNAPRHALSRLLAQRHRLESRAGGLHHLRRVARPIAQGHRGRRRQHREGRDVRPLPDLFEDALPSQGHGGPTLSQTISRRWRWMFPLAEAGCARHALVRRC